MGLNLRNNNKTRRKWVQVQKEAEPFGFKNQVNVLKMKRQIKSYGCLILLP